MTEQEQKNQEYLQWFFRVHEPQRNWADQEIRPRDIIPMPKSAVFTNPWTFHGLAAAR